LKAICLPERRQVVLERISIRPDGPSFAPAAAFDSGLEVS
jgi:hypothetical protein